jgi:hypothetical protein
MLRRLTAARATKKPSRACALGGFFLRHIFAVAGTLRVPLSQPQKRHIQPERYATLEKYFIEKYQNIYLTKA